MTSRDLSGTTLVTGEPETLSLPRANPVLPPVRDHELEIRFSQGGVGGTGGRCGGGCRASAKPANLQRTQLPGPGGGRKILRVALARSAAAVEQIVCQHLAFSSP